MIRGHLCCVQNDKWSSMLCQEVLGIIGVVSRMVRGHLCCVQNDKGSSVLCPEVLGIIGVVSRIRRLIFVYHRTVICRLAGDVTQCLVSKF